MSESDVYRRFVSIWANGEPVRDAHQLGAAVRAAKLTFDQVTDDWLRSLSRDWVHGYTDAPFEDEQANRVYRRELT